MGHGDFTVLVTALLGIRNLVFDLYAAGTSFDHLLGQQVRSFFVTKTGVNVGNNRYDMCFEVVDLGLNLGLSSGVASFTGGVKFTK